MSLMLKDILLNFPHISQAVESENAELLSFYHQTQLHAKSNTIIYKRGESFFLETGEAWPQQISTTTDISI